MNEREIKLVKKERGCVMDWNAMSFYGLIFDCPMGNELRDCAFKDIRKMNLHDRINFLNSMSDEQKSEIIKRHKHCLSCRENKVPFSRIAIYRIWEPTGSHFFYILSGTFIPSRLIDVFITLAVFSDKIKRKFFTSEFSSCKIE